MSGGGPRSLRKKSTSQRKESDFIRNGLKSAPSGQRSKQIPLSQVELLKAKIEEEKAKVEEYDNQIRMYQEKIQDQRKQIGGVNANKENSAKVQKEIKILENRLDKANQKYNEAVASNRKLREEIDNLRRERVIFDNIYHKLDKELNDKRNEMKEIIVQAEGAYKERDKAQDQLESLKTQAQREQAEFEREWKELNALIEKDKKMKQFMKQKEKERNESEIVEEGDILKKGKMAESGESKSKGLAYVSAERVKAYEDAFSQIEKATGIKNIEELVSSFIEAEKKNDTLSNYVNELNVEIENLDKQISNLDNEIEKYQGQGGTSDTQRKKLLKELESKLSRTENKAEQYESRYAQALKTIKSIKQSVENMYHSLECSQEGLEFTGVTESNMLMYLGAIEKRSNEILHTYAILQAQKLPDEYAREEALYTLQSVMAVGPSQNSQKVNVDVNQIKDDYSEEDASDLEEVDLPLTIQELRLRSEKHMASQQNRTKKTSKKNTAKK